jgi:SAM-dependent methyltransferase
MADAGSPYVMGRTPGETRRLQLQGEVYAGRTGQLLRMAGIRPGMRILDAGCGAGDVTMEAARITGASGSVLGVDADAGVLAVARRRAAEAGLGNVGFEQAVLPDVPVGRKVDALIGRLILVHLDDPARALRKLSHLVVPGGIIAFQDFNVSRARPVPEVALMTRCIDWICASLRAAGRDPDTGGELFSIFRQAGLPIPEVTAAIPATSEPVGCELAAATAVSLLPVMQEAGIASAEEVGPDTLDQRLWADMCEAGALLILPELVSGWARTPGG